jgi:hypothetical protein
MTTQERIAWCQQLVDDAAALARSCNVLCSELEGLRDEMRESIGLRSLVDRGEPVQLELVA